VSSEHTPAEKGQHGVFQEGVHVFHAPILAVTAEQLRYRDPVTRQEIRCHRSRLAVAMDSKEAAMGVANQLKRALADHEQRKRESGRLYGEAREAILARARKAKIGGKERPA
jgi:hypothetical protein